MYLSVLRSGNNSNSIYFGDGNKCKFDNLNRKVSDDEYDDVVNYAIDLGVTNAFVQEGEAASESFIPEFNKDII